VPHPECWMLTGPPTLGRPRRRVRNWVTREDAFRRFIAGVVMRWSIPASFFPGLILILSRAQDIISVEEGRRKRLGLRN
jgi:hypothetical protein